MFENRFNRVVLPPLPYHQAKNSTLNTSTTSTSTSNSDFGNTGNTTTTTVLPSFKSLEAYTTSQQQPQTLPNATAATAAAVRYSPPPPLSISLPLTPSSYSTTTTTSNSTPGISSTTPSPIHLPGIENLIKDISVQSRPLPAMVVAATPSSNSPITTTTKKITKPNTTTVTTKRKKKQCVECKLFFSNLATHKQTHLSIEARPHICPTCQRGFARPNDLIRHQNSHLKEVGKYSFKCPFYASAIADNSTTTGADTDAENPTQITQQVESSSSACHQNGCFSRCDTYKNHLKALHFSYPAGTKKKNRGKVMGNCKACNQSFKDVDEWLKTHIETNDCKCMIAKV